MRTINRTHSRFTHKAHPHREGTVFSLDRHTQSTNIYEQCFSRKLKIMWRILFDFHPFHELSIGAILLYVWTLNAEQNVFTTWTLQFISQADIAKGAICIENFILRWLFTPLCAYLYLRQADIVLKSHFKDGCFTPWCVLVSLYTPFMYAFVFIRPNKINDLFPVTRPGTRP